MKKVNLCLDGGFAQFQTKLVTNASLKCEVCQEAMKCCNFKQEDLDEMTNAWIEGSITIMEDPVQPKQEPHEGEAAAKEELEDADAEQKEGDEVVEALLYLKKLAPTFQLLPGSGFLKEMFDMVSCMQSKYWKTWIVFIWKHPII